MKKLLLLPLVIIFLSACSPVRTHYFNTNRKLPSLSESKIEEKKNQPKEQFSDTTVIRLTPIENKKKNNIDAEFNLEIAKFEKGENSKNCDRFEYFSQTFADGDSLQYEAMFYHSECLAVNNNYAGAEKILSELISKPNLPSLIKQKSMVRLGQIYCLMTKAEEAEKIFSRLQSEFPNSIYLSIANCDFMKQVQ